MTYALDIEGLTKNYSDGFQALKGIDLHVREGDFFALLGPNGAGKSTTLGIVSSLVNKSGGKVRVFGHDIDTDLSSAKLSLGVVPQEFNFNQFEKVEDIVTTQAGYYGIPLKTARVSAEKYLKKLGLWDKRNTPARMLSGGMKRRLMIARALVHEPRLLILDEPTAGVDIELRRSMWQFLEEMNRQGTTIILTTHYIEEAEEMADRIGVIRQGEIILVEDKNRLMSKLGKKELRLQLQQKLDKLPGELTLEPIELSEDGYELIYTFDSQQQQAGVARLLRTLGDLDIEYRDLQTRESSLEEIFVGLVHE